MSDSAPDALPDDLPSGFDVLATDEQLSLDIAEALSEVEARLIESLSSTDALVNTSARHLAEAGGKRIRPLLTILTSMLGRGVNDEVLQAAAVMEMTHLATLYHDDVMDSAPLRRGAPSAHEVWGNSVAILTGDLILARASQLMSELGPAATHMQAVTFERLVLGQLQETVGPQQGEDPTGHYLSVIGGKTASLLAAASWLGAHYGGCSLEATGMLQQYGEAVGVAFQLADDVIDLSADSGTSGKTPGTDLREGVPTLPVLLLRQAAAQSPDPEVVAGARAVLDLVDGDLSDDADLARAVEAVLAHPATEESWAVAHSWATKAKDAIAGLPDSTVKRALNEFADAVVDRER